VLRSSCGAAIAAAGGRRCNAHAARLHPPPRRLAPCALVADWSRRRRWLPQAKRTFKGDAIAAASDFFTFHVPRLE
jgi:hypothetical protein